MALSPAAERERYVAFAFAAADLLVELDPDGRVTFAAGAFEARLGCPPEAVVGRAGSDLLAPEDRAAFATALASLPARGRLAPTAFHLANPARSAFAVAGLHLPGRAEASRICLTFAPLCAAPATRQPSGDELLREAERRIRAGERGSLSLLEVHGPPHEAAAAIEAVLRQEGPGALAARLAPGRFGVLVEGAALPRNLASLLEHAAGGAITIGGPLPFDAEGLTPAQTARALRHGLAAFARGGSAGLAEAGGAEGLGAIMGRVMARAQQLRRVVAARRFGLLFQPIVALSDRRVSHYEALLRPDESALAPGETTQDFVTLAETVGMTEELDLAVASAALAATAAVPAGQEIAFNISGLSAQSAGFRDRLLTLLQQERRAAQRVIVELTETAGVEDEPAAAATMRALRERGLRVCLDDFGAGAAAFRYLQLFPVDFVKVDGAFVRAAAASERDRGFVASMVSLSLNVGARVVAEHVDSEDTSALMGALGVHYGQGFLFGRPGPL
jgi:EAL domain-containing protein (putative c-di-GMP-specific phosphodiesterase class I)